MPPRPLPSSSLPSSSATAYSAGLSSIGSSAPPLQRSRLFLYLGLLLIPELLLLSFLLLSLFHLPPSPSKVERAPGIPSIKENTLGLMTETLPTAMPLASQTPIKASPSSIAQHSENGSKSTRQMAWCPSSGKQTSAPRPPRADSSISRPPPRKNASDTHRKNFPTDSIFQWRPGPSANTPNDSSSTNKWHAAMADARPVLGRGERE